MKIPHPNPMAGYLAQRSEIQEAVTRVLDSGWYILGAEVEAFEREFAAYLGVTEVVTAASGTDALELALRACGVGRGDEVVTVSQTAVATVAAIDRAGAAPVLVDVNPRTYTMEVNEFDLAARRPAVKAVIPVHLYGQPADMPAILEVAKRRDLFVIEDCAQAHGAAIGGRRVGDFGHLAAFSFYPTKNLAAIGDGGAVATGNPALASKVRALRQYGWNEERVSECPGLNSRLDEMQAAILRVRLRSLEAGNARRRKLAAAYDVRLRTTSLVLPPAEAGTLPVYHQYVVRARRRDELRAWLLQHGVGSGVHYPVPAHLQPAYSKCFRQGTLKVSEQVAREVVSLPMYPELTEEQVTLVCERIEDWERR